MEGEKYSPTLFKRNLHFLSIALPMPGGLSAYFLGNQIVYDAVLLPVLIGSEIHVAIPDYNG